MTPEKVTRPATVAVGRYAALALRRDVSLGVLLSTHPRDFGVLLAAAAQAFPKCREFSEREVNDLLRAFLGDAGSMLGTDHVELRRWLVDFHVLDRDGYGRVYTAGAPAADIADSCGQLAGVDHRAVARAARDQDAALRAQRKERWQNAERDSHG
ncbi:MAG: DUF2087 domain-containing protein [Casimicrobiaceae bacterium]